MRGARLGALAGAALVSALLGCEGERPLAWFWQLEPGLEATVVVETRVRMSGCDGATIYEARADRGGASSMPEALAPGTYGLEVVARDANCQVIGERCSEVTLPSGDAEILVTVEPVTPRPACVPGTQCDEGRCVGEDMDAGRDAGPDAAGSDAGAVDAGPDASPPDAGDCGGCFDGTACQPGTTEAACGTGGAECVACGCSGDVCVAGVCVAAQPGVSVAAGSRHTCAVSEAGRLYCWGADDQQQRAANDSPVPNIADARSDWVEVSASGSMTCGRRGSSGDALECWGHNSAGQLGRGATSAPSASPQPLVPPLAASAIGAGVGVVLAVDTAGQLWCWGDNAHWGCASDTPNPVTTAQQIGTDTTWSQVSAGIWTACGIRGGDLLCWGWNVDGEAGNGTSGNSVRSLALIDASSDPFVEVAAGIGHACGRRASGTVACWGCGDANCVDWIEGSCGPGDELGRADGDCSGKLGTGVAVSSTRPVELSLQASAIDVGGHSCAIGTDGALYCWGPNFDGQVGAGDTTAHLEPVRIAGPRWTTLSVGYRHACAIREGGAVYCWGRNAEDQVGASGDSSRPLRVCLR